MEDHLVSTLEVRKDDWADTRIKRTPLDTHLKENEVLFKVNRIALTSNNISYASAGDALAYWEFFPTSDGWGRIPGMGWAEVIGSKHTEITVGERVWGFFPYTSHHKILAGRSNSIGFKDVSKHRNNHASVYVQFDRASSFSAYDPSREDQDILLRGLYTTSWLVEDFLDTNDLFGAQDCLITSASSKTSIALAHAIKKRDKLKSIGITSPRNMDFCKNLGCYDQIFTYDQIHKLKASRVAVMVDMAGSAEVISAVHQHYKENLAYSCLIGSTHHDKVGSVKGLPGPRPIFFFAPLHMQQRSQQLGAELYSAMLVSDYAQFRQFCDSWLTINRSYGEQAVTDIYQQVLAGNVEANLGQVVSLCSI